LRLRPAAAQPIAVTTMATVPSVASDTVAANEVETFCQRDVIDDGAASCADTSTRLQGGADVAGKYISASVVMAEEGAGHRRDLSWRVRAGRWIARAA
jgi:hypothetical protein